MKYLGIDYGQKRIGVAVSDDDGRVAFPLEVVAAGPAALSAVDALIKKNRVQTVVVGESRDLGGAANTIQEDIEQFKKDLEELCQVPVVFEPEFFTTALAGRQGQDKRGEGGVEKSDSSAAALILQSYLDRKK
jgi:putative Holliday junction resolvase